MNVYSDNSLSIGRTPLVKLNKLVGSKATVLGKVEGRNPGYSVKCRIGASMVWDAEKRGVLKEGMTIVEPTSGNTGIALACVAAARGYKLKLTMPDTMSIERRRILQAFGAEVELTPGAGGMAVAVQRATEILESDPEQFFLPQQFENPANPKIHIETTGPEIWTDTDGEVDVIVAGVGTGGTITGLSKFFKEVKGRDVVSVAVEPEASPVLTQTLAGEALKPGPHKIQGIGAGFVPGVLDLSLVNRVELVSNEESMEVARRLAQEEGLLSGISSGAATAVAMRLAADSEFEGKNIVVILPDSGERYLSTPLFD